MSTEKISSGTWQIYCDFCEASECFTGNGFKEMWEKGKEEGWRCFKEKETGEWKHKCPACLEAWRDGRDNGTKPKSEPEPEPESAQAATDDLDFGEDEPLDGPDPLDDFVGEEPFDEQTPYGEAPPEEEIENPF